MNKAVINSPSERTLNYIFWAFLIIHVLAWTLVPFFVRYTLPLDSMEGYVWGQQLQWGYDKNPFMNGWLTALAVYWGGYSGWMIYFFSQLSVAFCFWGVWRLGKKILPPVYALLGVLLLEAVQYYNFHAIDFNDNTLELSLWALLSLCFYQALRGRTAKEINWAWIGCGIFAGLCMMTKYYSVVLFAPMLLFFVLFKENYAALKRPGFYLGVILFLAIITPHIVWLFSHDFVTITYAFDRVSSPPTLWNHITYPWQFFYEQFEAILPALLLALILLLGKKPALQKTLSLTRFDKTFLIIVGLGPFLCTALLSFLAGFKLRAGWGEPLFSLGGLLLIAYLQPRMTPTKLYSFVGILASLLLLALGGYSKAFIDGKKPSSANFPGAVLARNLTHVWHERYHQALPYVAGSRWLSGNIAFYSHDHPKVYINWNKKFSPWINESELKEKGAIFIWGKDEPLPQDFKERFPNIEQQQIVHLTWYRNKNLPPIEVNVAFLPPRS
ncbi:MAG TPA: glycosyltransferase family 39 protein [Gammaproteobacteria bacterium]|nr:glycosyltransferase family 39 protein [Gammaproteobacteria bacterium]